MAATEPGGEKLPDEPHCQHAGSEEAGEPERVRERLVEVEAVEVSARGGVADDLHAIDGRLGERRQIVADAQFAPVERSREALLRLLDLLRRRQRGNVRRLPGRRRRRWRRRSRCRLLRRGLFRVLADLGKLGDARKLVRLRLLRGRLGRDLQLPHRAAATHGGLPGSPSAPCERPTTVAIGRRRPGSRRVLRPRSPPRR